MEKENGVDNQQPTTGKGKGQRLVVMTGGTSGISVHAVRFIGAQPDTRIIIGARGGGRTMPEDVEIIHLDLASLDSVRSFAGAVIRKIGNKRIDILILNAGMQISDTERKSADGYELTFAVNHLAHYLLARLLMPYMAEGGRLVFTTSETHDPAVTPLAPKTFEPKVWAYPRKSGFGAGMRAYAASKLCVMLTAHSFAALEDVKNRKIIVIAYSPGLTGGTGLGRDASPARRLLMRALMHTIFRVVGLFRPEYVIGKPERGGEALAEFALGTSVLPDNRIYVSLVKGKPKFPDPSEIARNREAQDLLWRQSAAMVGLDQ